MAAKTAKFKSLEAARALLPPGVVPRYEWVKGCSVSFPGWARRPLILRTALQEEGAPGHLQSGRSLSIPAIHDQRSLDEALSLTAKQDGLVEQMIQDQVPWTRHLTVFVEKDTLLVEVRTREGSSEVLFHSPQTGSSSLSSHDLRARLKPILAALKPLLEDAPHWLLELGELEDQSLFLFQIQPVARATFEQIFSSPLALEVIRSQERFRKSATFFGLLRMEWNAMRFRNHVDRGTPPASAPFLNWEFLFHYFRIFCLTQKSVPDSASFSRFLSVDPNTSWLGQMIHRHLKIASSVREDETHPLLPSEFLQGSLPSFIGRGTIEGILGVDIFYFDQLQPEVIYQVPRPKAFLTSSVSLLSHPVLACSELGIGLVLGIDPSALKSFERGTPVKIDFSKRILSL